MQEVSVKNLGPIEELTFGLSDYGVTILTAPNGSGKSILIDAMQKMASKSGRLPLKDGERRGELSAFGATVTIGASTRYKGEFDVLSLEGRCDLASLVDPGLKSEEAADRARIKALVGLTGVSADSSLFSSRKEFSGFKSIVNPSSLETTDPIEMAARIKRDYEAAARLREQEAERETNHAEACEARIENVDFSVATTVEDAKAKHSAALSELTRLETSRENQDRHAELIAEAKERLAEIKAKRKGVSVEQLIERITEEASVVAAKQELVRQLGDQLRAANDELKDAVNAVDATRREYAVAKQHAEEIASLEETISGDREEPITDAQLETARQAVATAEAAFDSARQMESAIRDKEQAKRHREASTTLRKQATDLRVSARATDEVLSDAIQCAAMRVVTEDGKTRLVTDHPKRGQGVPFGELSEGERWRIAIDLGRRRLARTACS